MAVAAPIIYPTVYKPKNPNVGISQLATLGDGSNTILAQQFVLNTSGAWVKYAAAGIIVAGLCPDASHTATDEPFNALYGENHNPIDPRSCFFLMNLTDNSGTEGSGTTTQGSVVLGKYYATIYGGTTTGALMINLTTAAVTAASVGGVFWKVVGLYNSTTTGADGDASADFNGRVIVEVDVIGLQGGF